VTGTQGNTNILGGQQGRVLGEGCREGTPQFVRKREKRKTKKKRKTLQTRVPLLEARCMGGKKGKKRTRAAESRKSRVWKESSRNCSDRTRGKTM